MTTLLDKAIEKLRELPVDRQDEAAEIFLSLLAQGSETFHLDAAQVAAVKDRLEETSPRTASHAEVLAFFHGSRQRS